jgi:hypothetical protein
MLISSASSTWTGYGGSESDGSQALCISISTGDTETQPPALVITVFTSEPPSGGDWDPEGLAPADPIACR